MAKVLVIDDEAQIRRFLRAGFELHGFTVVEAENAAAGLKAATMGAADLIILDLNLPDLEGSDVLERIRSWSNIPVIVLSIHSDEHEKVRLLRMGADDYVVKPFGIAELLARSDAALRRHLRSTNREPVVRSDCYRSIWCRAW
jgi:two-component system, OmpR family, KDP operon response regulator KdpE